LRKTLIGAVAALTALALAAVAMAQNPAPTASLEVSVAPTKVGTKKKPKNGRLELKAETNRESKSTASRIEIFIPKGAKLSTKGLKSCAFGKLNAQGKNSCPKGSKAGSGEADALLNPYATNPAPIKFVVTAFSGGKLSSADAATLKQQFPNSGSLYRKGREVINFHLQSASPEVDQALAGVISKSSGRLYGQKLTIDIAPNLQQPATNVYSSLQRLETSVGLKRKKNYLMSLTDCPGSRENQFQLRLTFVPNPTPPATSTATAVDGARCSG
jgi:hypothetical protein